MNRYLITQRGDIVNLELISDEPEKISVQMTFTEFCLFMQYPNLSKEELLDKIWEICDKSQGKQKIAEMIETTLKIMRGEEDVG